MTRFIHQANTTLRELLEDKSQKEICIRSGINQSTISFWRRGVDMGGKQLEKLADAFDYRIQVNIKFVK